MKRSIIIIIVIALIGAITWTLVSNKREINSKKEVKTTNQDIAVTVTAAGVKAISNQLKLVGTAEANRDVIVASDLAGKVTQINFKLGDFVNNGSVLAQVDDTYKRLALENAQLNYNKYSEDYERYQILRKGDAVSETQLRDMKLAYENAEIQLNNAKKQMNDTKIVAPFSGYITSKNTELGAYLNVGAAVAGMVDISQLKVVVSVSESNVYSLKQGQTVNVTTSVYPEAGYSGTISHISPKGDNAHTYPVEIMISNNKEYPLKAGTYVNIEVNMGKSAPALMIPRDAIVSSVKDPSVYKVEGNIAKLVKITTGGDNGSYVEVLSGIKDGDLVVTNGQINLMDGAQVSIIKK